MKKNKKSGKVPESTAIKKSICILGAGISGLSMAYYLLKLKKPEDEIDITIYEKESMPGGHCCTYNVKLDNKTGLHRWVDMGVNDFNASTYTELDKLMKDARYPKCPPLQNEECYGTSDGSICFTNDGRFNTRMSKKMEEENKRFQENAFKDMKNPKYAYYTLNDYVTEQKYDADFINNNLYPRVNGMYFCSGAPGEMPLRVVMSYYGLQEGYGTGKPVDRRYFFNGSISWIQALTSRVLELARKNILNLNKPDIKIVWRGDGIAKTAFISEPGKPLKGYNDIILAMPADEALKCFADITLVPQEIIDMLIQFQYVSDELIAHTDARCLQPQINSWRTYNIHIYDSKNYNYGPYTISYVVNRHQDDPNNPAYNKNCENPQLLVSANPAVTPAASSILLRRENDQLAKKVFRHQKLNLNTIRSQEKLKTLQGRYGLHYVNGYASGAGLHEECILHARYIAEDILQIPHPHQNHFDLSPGAKQYAPDYILNAMKSESTVKNKKKK